MGWVALDERLVISAGGFPIPSADQRMESAVCTHGTHSNGSHGMLEGLSDISAGGFRYPRLINACRVLHARMALAGMESVICK